MVNQARAQRRRAGAGQRNVQHWPGDGRTKVDGNENTGQEWHHRHLHLHHQRQQQQQQKQRAPGRYVGSSHCDYLVNRDVFIPFPMWCPY